MNTKETRETAGPHQITSAIAEIDRLIKMALDDLSGGGLRTDAIIHLQRACACSEQAIAELKDSQEGRREGNIVKSEWTKLVAERDQWKSQAEAEAMWSDGMRHKIEHLHASNAELLLAAERSIQYLIAANMGASSDQKKTIERDFAAISGVITKARGMWD